MINILTTFFEQVVMPGILMTVTPSFVLSLYDNKNLYEYMPGNEYSWTMTLIFMIIQYFFLIISDKQVEGPLTTKNDKGFYKGNGLETYIITNVLIKN